MTRVEPDRPVPAGALLGAALVVALAGCAPARQIGTDKPAPFGATSQKPPPIRAGALNIVSDCSFRDPNGYRGELKLHVTQAEVRAFTARVDVPHRGSCQFDLKDFRQAAYLPNVVLRAHASACTVHMWEQGRRVTVAFNDCADRCTTGAYPYLWPILADARSHGCG